MNEEDKEPLNIVEVNPSILLDKSYLETAEDDATDATHIDFNGDEQVYSVRKFSTSKKSERVIAEGERQEWRCTTMPEFCSVVIGARGVGKSSICRQMKSNKIVFQEEDDDEHDERVEVGVEVDGLLSR